MYDPSVSQMVPSRPKEAMVWQEMVFAVIPARGPYPGWLLASIDSGSFCHFHPHPPTSSPQERSNLSQ